VNESAEKRRYVHDVLDLYVSLPGTPPRFSRQDRRLAATLCDRSAPADIVRAAMLLAVARRVLRSADAPALPPIRTLFYFLPVIDELTQVAPDASYIEYLEAKLRPLVEEKRRSLPATPPGRSRRPTDHTSRKLQF